MHSDAEAPTVTTFDGFHNNDGNGCSIETIKNFYCHPIFKRPQMKMGRNPSRDGSIALTSPNQNVAPVTFPGNWTKKVWDRSAKPLYSTQRKPHLVYRFALCSSVPPLSLYATPFFGKCPTTQRLCDRYPYTVRFKFMGRTKCSDHTAMHQKPRKAF